MENKEMLLVIVALAAGIVLQAVVRLSGRANGKWRELALNILKDGALLCVQILLIFVFSGNEGNGTGHEGCILASCCTFGFAVVVLLLQNLYKRKYPLSDRQKMELDQL